MDNVHKVRMTVHARQELDEAGSLPKWSNLKYTYQRCNPGELLMCYRLRLPQIGRKSLVHGLHFQ
jgi:hypothetical protein